MTTTNEQQGAAGQQGATGQTGQGQSQQGAGATGQGQQGAAGQQGATGSQGATSQGATGQGQQSTAQPDGKELADLRAFKAKAEADARAVAEKEMLAKGEFEKALDLHKSDAAQLKAKLEQRDAADRKRAVIDKVLTGVPEANREAVHGAYLIELERHGWEVAPTDVEAAAKTRRETIEKAKPDLFKATGKPGPTGGTRQAPNVGGSDGQQASRHTPAWQRPGVPRL
jgi:hypothetical protein